MNNLDLKTLAGLVAALVVLAAAIFLTAWTLDYWQGWVFLAVFSASTAGLIVYWMINDPNMLEQRLTARTSDEKEGGQRIIQAFRPFGMFVVFIFPVLDHRFGWSAVPPYVSIAGDVLIALGMYLVILVFRENTYASPLVEVGEEQKVITTGPYALVRHPMYSAALIWFVGVPLALGSAWGVLLVVPITLVLVWRLLDEEKLLSRDLSGYVEYKHKVRTRLVPLVW
jgi:protein-S-isoprenylcysteine O-methyltransferase Ste14